MATVNVDIEYCGGCGYLPKFQELSEKIRDSVPTANITGTEGRTGSFEVTVNGQLIHSKLSTMAFPDFENVTDIVGDVAAGKEVKLVAKQQPINCTIV